MMSKEQLGHQGCKAWVKAGKREHIILAGLNTKSLIDTGKSLFIQILVDHRVDGFTVIPRILGKDTGIRTKNMGGQ